MILTMKLLEMMVNCLGINTNIITETWEQSAHEQYSAKLVENQRNEKGNQLPDFFSSQHRDNFAEEALEDDPSLSLNYDSNAYPTAKTGYNNESDFFFLDTETEANAVENLFSQVCLFLN